MSINSDELDAIVSAARKMVDRLDGRGAERFLGETFTDLKSAVENYSVGPFDLDSNEVKSRRETQTYRLIQEVDMFLHGLMEDDKYKNGAGELHGKIHDEAFRFVTEPITALFAPAKDETAHV